MNNSTKNLSALQIDYRGIMIDYFIELKNKIRNDNSGIKILNCEVMKCNCKHTFDLFKSDISDKTKYLYNNYQKFTLYWEETANGLHGFVDFVPYDKIRKENGELCEIAKNMDAGLIEKQDVVVEDIIHWYPIFRFPNGDAFCYDNRNGKIVFYDHEVFDIGINLHGLTIAETIDTLLEKWSKVLFIDIYDWYDGVGEHGIDLSMPVYKTVLHINEQLSSTSIRHE